MGGCRVVGCDKGANKNYLTTRALVLAPAEAFFALPAKKAFYAVLA